MKLKHALERTVQYTLKVISVMKQPLKKFITKHVLLKHSGDKEGVSGTCKAFTQMKT